MVATTGGASLTGLTNINTTGSSTTTIATGGTGNLAIGNTTGKITVTAPSGSPLVYLGLDGSNNIVTSSNAFSLNPFNGTVNINTSGSASTAIGNAFSVTTMGGNLIFNKPSATISFLGAGGGILSGTVIIQGGMIIGNSSTITFFSGGMLDIQAGATLSMDANNSNNVILDNLPLGSFFALSVDSFGVVYRLASSKQFKNKIISLNSDESLVNTAEIFQLDPVEFFYTSDKEEKNKLLGCIAEDLD